MTVARAFSLAGLAEVRDVAGVTFSRRRFHPMLIVIAALTLACNVTLSIHEKDITSSCSAADITVCCVPVGFTTTASITVDAIAAIAMTIATGARFQEPDARYVTSFPVPILVADAPGVGRIGDTVHAGSFTVAPEVPFSATVA
jgi:hypothetical protein